MRTELIHSFSSNSLANLARGYNLSSKGQGQGQGKDNVGYVFEEGEDNQDIENRLSTLNSNSNSDPKREVNFVRGLASSIFRWKTVKKRFPILSWIEDYNWGKFVADVISGLTIGLTLLPQGLAYGRLAGLPPQWGLYSGFVGCFVYLFFGSCKVITIGPTALMSILTLSYVEGKPPEYALILSFCMGIVTFLMGLLQLGFITNFISTPTISGFTSASALTICATQIKPLLGLHFGAHSVREIVMNAASHLGQVKPNDAILSVICILLLLFLQNLEKMFGRWTKDCPKVSRLIWFISTGRSVIVLTICTLIFSSIGQTLFPVDVVGEITPGLPPIRPPPFFLRGNVSGEIVDASFNSLIQNDASALIVLPLIALMEHITIAKKFSDSGMLDSSQEMIAIGLTNIVGSFFGSIPVTGSFSRSTVNAASGAESPVGGIITGTLVLLALQFLTPYFYFIPNAALAAVIVSAVIFTVDFRIALDMWRSKRMDLIPWLATFVLSLIIGLEVGILSGIVISVGFLLFYSARPAIQLQKAQTCIGNEFVIIGLDRSLVFPSIEYIRYMVTKSATNWAANLPLVIDCHYIQYCDFSAAQGIRDLVAKFNSESQPLILWRAKPSIIRVLGGLMTNSKIPFLHTAEESELERMVDGDDHPIEFNASPKVFHNEEEQKRNHHNVSIKDHGL